MLASRGVRDILRTESIDPDSWEGVTEIRETIGV